MSEITPTDLQNVKKHIQADFNVEDTNLAEDFAKIAVFLSTEQAWKPMLIEISGRLEAKYWQIVFENKKNVGNLLTRAIVKCAADLGFDTMKESTIVGATFAGFIKPDNFIHYVEEGLFWKDAVSSNHGEHSHSVQWLMIAASNCCAKNTNYIYKQTVKFKSKSKYIRPVGEPGDIYLWDFLVDCFNFGKLFNWQDSISTKTCRSPTHLNETIFMSDIWLSKYLKGRYKTRDWQPSGEVTDSTKIRENAIKKHTANPNFKTIEKDLRYEPIKNFKGKDNKPLPFDTNQRITGTIKYTIGLLTNHWTKAETTSVGISAKIPKGQFGEERTIGIVVDEQKELMSKFTKTEEKAATFLITDKCLASKVLLKE